MRALARYAVPFALITGLTAAFAPAAGATTGPDLRPVTHVFAGRATFSITNPCDGSEVQVAGPGSATTTTAGQRTAATITDRESGDGYSYLDSGTASFDALGSTYLVPVNATWLNLGNPALSFQASFSYTVTVNSANVPISYAVSGVTGTCSGPAGSPAGGAARSPAAR